jgi:diphosphomevalonate decarboxylase
MNLNDFKSVKIINEISQRKYSWESPSNIALVKYWGKNTDQTPKNPSISFTLSNCKTTTNVEFTKSSLKSDSVDFEIIFEGQKNKKFRPKIEKYFSNILEYCPYLINYDIIINTNNSFPHSSGIASSASGMSALSLCIMSFENDLTDLGNKEYFYKKASFLSRIGSGSACRSIYGGINLWGANDEFKNSSDLYSIKLEENISSNFDNYRDTILIIDKNEKEVSSSVGHELMNDHPFSKLRFSQAFENISKLNSILKSGNLREFCLLVESEALTLHSLMMSSDPSYLLMKPETLSVINLIQEFRKSTNIPVCFTLDAGANVHVLYPDENSNEVSGFIKNTLSKFCVNRKFIDDNIGKGPKQN